MVEDEKCYCEECNIDEYDKCGLAVQNNRIKELEQQLAAAMQDRNDFKEIADKFRGLDADKIDEHLCGCLEYKKRRSG